MPTRKQEKIFDDMNDPKRPVFEMDGYGKEALDITVDYLDLLGGNKIAVGPPTAARRKPPDPQPVAAHAE